MIILGIDPGTATTGFGVIKKNKQQIEYINHGIIATTPKEATHQRLKKLYLELNRVIQKFKPDVLAVEKLFFFKNLKTALPVSEARGVILLAAAQKKIALVQFTPLEVKTGICGYGRAEKKQVQKMVKEILCLERVPKPDDAADALAIAICCSYFYKN
ncbi:MAG: crossover junction endodeoxyribonuclease RuvC [Candidatus Pacebacteria bacterium]|nr:crossover junction endodeoxyribonuclease RuvC [Candidatus Paceibacterota bacterium]